MTGASGRGARGFSLAEALVVIAIIGLAIAIAIPVTAEQIRAAKARTAASEMSTFLKAARMKAVTIHKEICFQITPDPTNTYEYGIETDVDDGKVRVFRLPTGVRIVSPTSVTKIKFQPNGSIAAASTAILEVMINSDQKERYTLSTSVLGVTTITRVRVQA